MPKRGEVWLVDFGMAQKTRPAVILNVAYDDEDRAIVTVVSHTTSLRDSSYEIDVPVSFLREGAFSVQGITTVPAKYALRKLGDLTLQELAPIEEGVRRWLGL